METRLMYEFCDVVCISLILMGHILNNTPNKWQYQKMTIFDKQIWRLYPLCFYQIRPLFHPAIFWWIWFLSHLRTMEIQSAFENTHIRLSWFLCQLKKGPFLNCHGNKVNVRILRRRLHFLDPYGPYIK